MRAILIALMIIGGLILAGCLNGNPGLGNTTNTTNTTSGTNITIPPGYEVPDYCQKDSDCVRLNSCCDCGLGQYANIYNQKPPCTGPRCMCAIMLADISCNNNKCVGTPAIQVNPTANLTFVSGSGTCGIEVPPQREDTADGIALSGSVGSGSACRKAYGELIMQTPDLYILNITTRAIPGVAACIDCLGTIPWNATITGYGGQVDVYYDDRQVLPSPPGKSGFCGWSTNGTCSTDSDCTTGGCSSQVCQSTSENPVVTTCIYRECFDSAARGLSCGCVLGKCQWG
jgi:eight-cysteine-cluster-containing protein